MQRCRMPITQDDKASDRFKQGVSCHHCYDRLTASQKMRFRERQKQMELARQRGQAHMGDDAAGSNAANQASKLRNKNRQRTRNDSLQEWPDA